jgi:hypothetical protein
MQVDSLGLVLEHDFSLLVKQAEFFKFMGLVDKRTFNFLQFQCELAFHYVDLASQAIIYFIFGVLGLQLAKNIAQLNFDLLDLFLGLFTWLRFND